MVFNILIVLLKRRRMKNNKLFKFIRRNFRSSTQSKGHLHHALFKVTFDFLDFLEEHKQFQGISRLLKNFFFTSYTVKNSQLRCFCLASAVILRNGRLAHTPNVTEMKICVVFCCQQKYYFFRLDSPIASR